MSITVNIVDGKSDKHMVSFDRFSSASTIAEIKEQIAKKRPVYYTERQGLKLEKKGKSLGDGQTLGQLGLSSDCTLYFKDLGPQIGWATVFLAEYAGPLVVYLLFYLQPTLFYGHTVERRQPVVDIAAACHTFHYAKRILETLFVHRFSHSTMPISNLFKNCSYYWGFAAYMSYYINHPLYTRPASERQIFGGLLAFIFCEVGNFSVHLLLKNLRPPGSKERKIPHANTNPFTALFNLVSCPNYTYEIAAWVSFGIMTQCAPVLIFATCGAIQMTIWAQQKHRRYRKEFKDYPRRRTSIFPFII